MFKINWEGGGEGGGVKGFLDNGSLPLRTNEECAEL